VSRLIERFETEDVLMCLSEGRNFRYSVDPSYKKNRVGTRKPAAYYAVLKRVEDTWPSFKFDGLEADDVMGIFATRDPNTIICSADKDMKTIPCTLWDGKKVQKIDRVTADWWFFYQVLVGDVADGYPGLPSVGPKKAEAILNGARAFPSMWPLVRAAYEQRGLTEADAIKQARLARILRNEDWDAEKKEPILWTP
jgi:5'-3' exonuclease